MANSFLNKSRGIDAPESSMPYGKEAQNELIKIVQGKCLRVLVYGDDRYGRCVADLYCNGIFVQVLHSLAMDLSDLLIIMKIKFSNLCIKQEVMLKKGCAWHYSAYDQRSELAKVTNQVYLFILEFNFDVMNTKSSSICLLPVGKRGSSKESWVMGSIKPRRAMGMEKGQARRPIALPFQGDKCKFLVCLILSGQP